MNGANVVSANVPCVVASSLLARALLLARMNCADMLFALEAYQRSSFFYFFFLHEPQSLTMHYIRDERGDEALTLCRPMGLGFPALRTRQEGKEKRYERQ